MEAMLQMQGRIVLEKMAAPSLADRVHVAGRMETPITSWRRADGS
jgi:hypothetical protein